ncbi:MAG TPA: ABC transporter permease [Candidatus Bathyarchaeia archaeon]|nr:ABC transporter permease [Candidatus Bathyarchaeia archaeon]
MKDSKEPRNTASSSLTRKAHVNGLARNIGILIVFVSFALMVTFFGLPIAALFAYGSLTGFLNSLSSQFVVMAVQLSLMTTLATLLIVLCFGTPIAYYNARHRYRGKRIMETIIDLPIVLPPAVAGIALLLAFGRQGFLGQYLTILGVNIAFTTIAVVLAQIFVASPFYIRQATTSFEDVAPEYERAAHTLGASGTGTFFRVTVPIALNGLVSGALMTWARALGEFGATLLFAGNLPGVTQTMPLAIYTALESNLDAGVYLAIILVLISFTVIITVKVLTLREKGAAKAENSIFDKSLQAG